MDGELVSDCPSSNGDLAEDNPPQFSVTYTEKFNELFPMYLAIGMSYEQYWEQDSALVIAYRKAYEIKQENINQQLWLQGAYIYEAIARISPILHAFAKKGTKPIPYLDAPFSLTEKQEETKQVRKEKATFDKSKAIMESFMNRHNKKYEGIDSNEHND